MIINNFSVDQKKATQGAWISFELEGQVCSLKIARLNNPKHLEIAKELMKPFSNQINSTGEMSVEKTMEINYICLARSILLDWKEVYDDKHNEIKYTETQGIKYLSECPELYDFVNEEASKNANFRIKAMEKAAKN